MPKDMSFYIYEALQKKKELNEITREMLKELKTKNPEELKKGEKYKDLQNKIQTIISEIDRLKKEMAKFILENPEYSRLPNIQKIQSLISN
jgi:hypothetical protein